MKKVFIDSLNVEFIHRPLGNAVKVFKDGELIAIFPHMMAAQLFIEVFSTQLPVTCPVTAKWKIERVFIEGIGF